MKNNSTRYNENNIIFFKREDRLNILKRMTNSSLQKRLSECHIYLDERAANFWNKAVKETIEDIEGEIVERLLVSIR